MTGTADDERSGMSSTGALRAASRTQMPAAVRAYLAHERVILGTLMVLLLLIAWSSAGYLLGLVLAVAIGIPLGLAGGWYRRLSFAVEPFLAALNATPQVAFLPLIVIWVGTGLSERVLIIFLLAVLPLAINAHAAVRTTDPRLIKVAGSFGASEWQLFRTILLPSSVPFLLAGLRLAIGRGMIGVVVGEIYGSAAGLGAMINQAGARFQTDRVFVGVLTIVAAGVILVEVVQGIERRVEIWR